MQQEGNGQQSQYFASAQGVFAEHLQHIRKQRDAGAEEDESDEVERSGSAPRGNPGDADRPDTSPAGQSGC